MSGSGPGSEVSGTGAEGKAKRGGMTGHMGAPVAVGLALLYLVNPTAGIFELLPDNLPLVGNLDEAGAVLLLTNALAWYGVNIGKAKRGGKRSLAGHVVAPVAGGLALLYLVNPTAGIFELLPDNLPLVGNLDEAGAMLLLSKVLAWYGLDLNRFGRRMRG